ncbi:MAG: hypothetical protein ABSG15_02980 [FCB group bacterium]|jgi:hypothetical protein
MNLKLKIIVTFLFLVSCVRQPNEPINSTQTQTGQNGAFILCEGLWGMDNSTLSRYDFKTGDLINDYFSNINSGLRLGDLANDIVIKGDTAFISVSTSKTIEVITVSTGKSLGRLYLNGNNCPRKICIVNDTSAFITDLYANCIYEFNPKTIAWKNLNIVVGPAPEGITKSEKYLFVANSGYGDYFANKPKAGTISVIDLINRTEVASLINLPDVIEVIYNAKNQKLYAAYNNLPSLKDSTGGIVEFDADNFTELRRWKLNAKSISLSQTGDSLFFLSDSGASLLNLNIINSQPQLLIRNIINNEYWYSLAVSYYDYTIWIGNAKNYQVAGEIIIYDLKSTISPKIRFNVGVNPNKIVFF